MTAQDAHEHQLPEDRVSRRTAAAAVTQAEAQRLLEGHLAALPALGTLGAPGAAMAAAFRAAALPVTHRAETGVPAAAFYDRAEIVAADGARRWREEIVYGIEPDMVQEDFFNTYCHEMTHGLQYHNAPVCNMQVQIGELPFFLHPFDALMLRERMEQDAFAKAVWLELAAYPKASPGLSQMILEQRAHAIRVTRQAARGGHAPLPALAESVLEYMYEAEEDAPENLYDYYRGKILGWYEDDERQAHMREFIRDYGFGFVSLAESDILAVGGSFGPNSFADETGRLAAAFRGVALTAAQADRLAAVEAALGIRDEDVRPLDDVLAEAGTTRADIMRDCYGYGRGCGRNAGPG